MAQAPYTLTRLDGTEYTPLSCEHCEGYHCPDEPLPVDCQPEPIDLSDIPMPHITLDPAAYAAFVARRTEQDAMTTYQYRETFHSPYGDCGGVRCADLNGKPFAVVNVIEHETDLFGGIDEASCPMFRVNVGGRTITAWPEEVLTD